MFLDFSVWLIIFTIASAIIYTIDKFIFEPKRVLKNSKILVGLSKKERQKVLKAPYLGELGRGLFVVFLVVFILRSFVAEPFRIPTGSMLPTLEVGDFLLVNKFSYGIRNPLNNNILIEIGSPQRGDIVVFKYPVTPNVNFIKRIIGLPGDKISYIDKVLYINGDEISQDFLGDFLYPDNSKTEKSKKYLSNMIDFKHEILKMPWRKDVNFHDIIVPENSYFAMGDNRDNSEDSRYWGFVPKENLVGKAFIIWLSFGGEHFVRFDRIGTIL